MMNEGIWLSIFGGLGVQLIKLLDLHGKEAEYRPNCKVIGYYIPWIVNPLLGGLIGYAYFEGQININRILAIHVGASSSLIFRSMIEKAPKEADDFGIKS